MSAYMIIAPGAGLFWVALSGAGRRNGFPQPPSYVIVSFVAGILLTLPAFAAERAIQELIRPGSGLMGMTAGPIEETCKFAAAWFAAARFAAREGSEKMTAAAASASMGFAAVENVAYMAQFGPAAIPARTIVSPALHLAWALIWGRAMDRDRSAARAAGALLLGAVLHSAYNLAVETTVLAVIPALPLAGWIIWGAGAKKENPAQDGEGCLYCRGKAANITGICPACGKPARAEPCQGCGESVSPQAEFCHGCGLRQEQVKEA